VKIFTLEIKSQTITNNYDANIPVIVRYKGDHWHIINKNRTVEK